MLQELDVKNRFDMISFSIFHFQESTSSYKLVEVSTGGKLSRHNLHINQHGPETCTELSSFHLSIAGQIQDMYSRVVLDHPRGFSRQLHKCIAARASSQIVFNGNIKVNRSFSHIFYPYSSHSKREYPDFV